MPRILQDRQEDLNQKVDLTSLATHKTIIHNLTRKVWELQAQLKIAQQGNLLRHQITLLSQTHLQSMLAEQQRRNQELELIVRAQSSQIAQQVLAINAGDEELQEIRKASTGFVALKPAEWNSLFRLRRVLFRSGKEYQANRHRDHELNAELDAAGINSKKKSSP